MEATIHGLFTIVKLAVLGSIYATAALCIAICIALVQPHSWISRAVQQKVKFWFISGAAMSAALVLFATTHWGTHGFGDSAKLPLWYGRTICAVNGSQTYIEDIQYEGNDLLIKEFATTREVVVGRTGSDFAKTPTRYFVWTLATNHINYFDTEFVYQEFARAHELPPTQEFKGFWQHYSDFWHGWRFWTLL